MVELFPNVSKDVRVRAKFWVDVALLNPDPLERAKEILTFRNSLATEEEKQFVDFYVSYRSEEENRDEDYSDRA